MISRRTSVGISRRRRRALCHPCSRRRQSRLYPCRLRRGSEIGEIDPRRNSCALVPYLQGPDADSRRHRERARIRGPRRHPRRFRLAERRGQAVRRAQCSARLWATRAAGRSVGKLRPPASIAALLASRRSEEIAMTVRNVGLAYLAGLLSILLPCVLPLLPPVLGVGGERKIAVGPFALAAGVTLSFVVVGLFVATIRLCDRARRRRVHGVRGIPMIGVGVLLVSPSLQIGLRHGRRPISNWADQADQRHPVKASDRPVRNRRSCSERALEPLRRLPTLGAAVCPRRAGTVARPRRAHHDRLLGSARRPRLSASGFCRAASDGALAQCADPRRQAGQGGARRSAGRARHRDRQRPRQKSRNCARRSLARRGLPN